jgi:hypothetical protein
MNVLSQSSWWMWTGGCLGTLYVWSTYAERKLNDGRIYQVVKIFHEPIQLAKSLQDLGWNSDIHATSNHFIYGSVYPN